MTIRPADDETLSAAADLLRSGDVVAFPTETVYGLGADATQEDAVAKVFAIKGRPAVNPLIVHVGRPDWVAGLALPDGRFDVLVRTFWPGPLTLVMHRRPDSPVAAAVSANLDTIAVRQPSHPVAAALLSKVKRPLAAPSANPSGHVSPTAAEHVAKDLGDQIPLILDGGPCTAGIESTVLDLTDDTPRILRPGSIGPEAISDVIGAVLDHAETADSVTSPGQMEKHYAPSLPVTLRAMAGEPGDCFIGFGAMPDADLNLSPTSDLAEAATNLFAMLRAADDPDRYTGIAVSPIPDAGIGRAINDRLARAAKGR